jgi:hypothetical protein
MVLNGKSFEWANGMDECDTEESGKGCYKEFE